MGNIVIGEATMLWILAVLLGVIIAMISFIGASLISKIDTLFTIISKLENDIRTRVEAITERLIILETLNNIRSTPSSTPRRRSKNPPIDSENSLRK